MINSIAIQCPLCKGYINATEVHKIDFCNACRNEINYCNNYNKNTCFECVNTTISTDLNINNTKTRKYYGCHKGSRLAKYSKKHKIGKLEMLQYLRWGVCKELITKEKLIRTAEYVYKQKESIEI